MSAPHDIVVYGATGFVGRLTAGYLARTAPASARIALGGRSRERLEAVARELGVDWPVVVADSGDADALRALAESTAVVASTVGPYAKYGEPLVRACAETGTHYADLTGEVPFVRRTIDTVGAAAEASGARIVHACGYDSIPSDLAMLLLHEAAGEPITEATMVVKALRGGFSGGTIDSIRGIADQARRDKASRRLLLDPFALSPDRAAEPSGGAHRDPTGVVRDPALGGALAPFIMGSYNSRIVRRSNALLGHAYGPQLRYRELMLGGPGPLGLVKAAGIASGVVALIGGLALPLTRTVLDRVLPDPGEGPSEAARDRGFFAHDTHATTASGRRLVCRVRGDGDPGYKATALMLGESALSLALDDDLPDRAGVLTPATAMGDALVARLRAAGQTYEV